MQAFLLRRMVAPLLIGLAMLLAASSARAQFVTGGGGGPRFAPNTTGLVNPLFQVAPGLTLQQAAFNTRVIGNALRRVPPYALGYNPYPQVIATNPVVTPVAPVAPIAPVVSNPYLNGGGAITSNPVSPGSGYVPPVASPGYGYPPFGGIYVPNPYGEYLRGVADVLNARGQYGIDYNRARLLNQDVWQARIETKRKLFEARLYYLRNKPTTEEIRRKEFEQAVIRARNNPPLTEVLSGDTLNVLLKRLNKLQLTTLGPKMPVEADVLDHINVTTGRGGNIGLLKNEGELSWPRPLRDEQFEAARKQIDRFAPDAVAKARNTGKVDMAVLKQLNEAWDTLDRQLDASARGMSQAKYIESRRYLGQLRQALRALEDPQVSNFFTKKFAANGKTVGDLVKNMRTMGLSFAPAVIGDEAAYRSLYQSLVAYEYALTKEGKTKD